LPSSYWVTLAFLDGRRATEPMLVSLLGDSAVLGQPTAEPRLFRTDDVTPPCPWLEGGTDPRSISLVPIRCQPNRL
jgi:hypothetical protein